MEIKTITKYILLIILIISFVHLINLNKTEDSSDNSIPDLTYHDKEELINVAYQAVDDFFNDKTTTKFPSKYNNIKNKVFIAFRVNGKKRGSWSARKNNLAETVYHATLNTLKDIRYGEPLTKEDLSNLKIEIFILGKENYLNKETLQGYEPGIHGLRIENNKNQATYYNSVAIEGNYKTKKLISKLCKKVKLTEDCLNDPNTNLFYFNTLHFATTRFSDKIITFYRSNIINNETSKKEIESSLNLAKSWFLNNIHEDGSITYQYNPSNGKYSTSNNMIRQFMASRLLSNLAIKDPSLSEINKKNLNYNLNNFYFEENNFGYIYYDNKSKLGANALAILALLESDYEQIDKLSNTLLYSQNKDGSFNVFYKVPNNYQYSPEVLSRYYSGEAALALTKLYLKNKDEKYLDAAIKAEDYYIKHIKENYHPAYVPWHTMALYDLYKITKDEKYIEAIFYFNDKLIQIQNTDGEPYKDYLGRFYDENYPEYGVPFSGSTSIYIEGLAYAYDLAKEKDYINKDNYKKSILLGARNLMNLQFHDSNMYYLQHPERVNGAIRYRVDDNRIRIDTTQHTIDAFNAILKFVYGDARI